MNGTLHIYVFREGFLARLGHDLRLTLQSFEVTLHEDSVSATFPIGAIRVDGAFNGDRVDATAITPKDKDGIYTAITHDIFHDQPEIHLEGTLDPTAMVLHARITMNGRTVGLNLPLTRKPGVLMVDLEITPSKWGIAQYKALGGGLRLQDRWRIHLHLPWDYTLDKLRGASERWGVEPTTA